jgi:hypothetical protein
MKYEPGMVGLPAPLLRISRFYAWRLLRRLERGEIDKVTAIDLLHAAAFGDARSLTRGR